MSTFRVVQFNMQFGQGWSNEEPHVGAIDLDATLAELLRQDADVIMLQEVERALPSGAQIQPPPNYTRLSHGLPGYHSWFSYPPADARELPFGLGLAIFSRTPLRDFSSTDLPSPEIQFEFEGRVTTPTNRLLIGAKTNLLGVEVDLLNTHLLAFFMLGTSSREHPVQRDRISQRLAQSAGPTVLAGDFNVRDHASLSAQFGSVGFKAVQSREITWRRQPYVLDHIFYNAPLQLVRHAVIPTMTSDHHLLAADFARAGQ